jgi:hypothetical protein
MRFKAKETGCERRSWLEALIKIAKPKGLAEAATDHFWALVATQDVEPRKAAETIAFTYNLLESDESGFFPYRDREGYCIVCNDLPAWSTAWGEA